MAEIRAIFGPYKTEEQTSRITWFFSGIRADGEFTAWSLRFQFCTRRYTCRVIKNKQAAKYAESISQKDLFVLPEVAQSEVSSGRVTDMLKAKLSPEQIARATALAIQYRRW